MLMTSKQNTLAVVVKQAYTVFGTVWVYMSMVYLNNSEKKNNATGNATTDPPISNRNTLLPVLVPIF